MTVPGVPDSSKEKIPPIVLRNGFKWTAVSAEIKRAGFSFVKAQGTVEGVRYFPGTEIDFRGSVKILLRG